MAVFQEIRRRARHVIGPTLGACVFGYFLYHSIQGDRGLIAWLQLNQQIKEAEAQLERSAAERDALAARVAQLRTNHLDPDLLDERARRVVGLVGKNDLVILTPTIASPRQPLR